MIRAPLEGWLPRRRGKPYLPPRRLPHEGLPGTLPYPNVEPMNPGGHMGDLAGAMTDAHAGGPWQSFPSSTLNQAAEALALQQRVLGERNRFLGPPATADDAMRRQLLQQQQADAMRQQLSAY